ncbi:hypothetical protein [Idiomarina xiamenensis]|nr:hypothetical protein [Idiomarina xiamenensis]
MMMSAETFQLLIVTALILSSLAPLILLALYVKDLFAKDLW